MAFSLAFGAMFAKTYRVYRIFTRSCIGVVKNKVIKLQIFLITEDIILTWMSTYCQTVVIKLHWCTKMFHENVPYLFARYNGKSCNLWRCAGFVVVYSWCTLLPMKTAPQNNQICQQKCMVWLLRKKTWIRKKDYALHNITWSN